MPGASLWSEVQPASATARAVHVSTAELANRVRVSDIPNSPCEVFTRSASQPATRLLLLVGGFLENKVCSNNEQTLNGENYTGTLLKINPKLEARGDCHGLAFLL